MKTDLTARARFYEPQEGEGAMIPLPEKLKKVARELDGKTMTLEEALKTISPVLGKGDFIDFLEPSEAIPYNRVSYSFKDHCHIHTSSIIKYEK